MKRTKFRVYCSSDFHADERFYRNRFGGEDDLFIYAGDITNRDSTTKKRDLAGFIKFLLTLPHFAKVVIMGNHDHLDPEYIKTEFEKVKEHGIIYLENERTNIRIPNTYREIVVFGSPSTMCIDELTGKKDAFYEGDLKKIWDQIPDECHVLVTHMPPKHSGIKGHDGRRMQWYCSGKLLVRVKQLKNLQLHAFGHVHIDGMVKKKWNARTSGPVLVNCSKSVKRFEFDVKLFRKCSMK